MVDPDDDLGADIDTDPDTETAARVEALLAERTRYRVLAAAGRRLGLSLHPGRTARTIVELAVADLADTAVVVWPSSPHGDVLEWVARERGGDDRTGRADVASLPTAVREALRGPEIDPRSLLLDDLADAPWARTHAGTGLFDGRPTARVPAVLALPGNGAPAGALVLVRRCSGPEASAAAGAADAALVEEFAQRAGIALAAAALHAQQVRTTAVLRDSLAQPPLPTVPGICFGAAYRPADEDLLIGGDLYGVLPRVGDVTTFLLGDVCGKGLDAAVSTGQLRQSTLVLRRLVPDPVRMVELLNATMLETAPPGRAPRFVTLVLGTATPRPDGGVTLRLAGGGHPPPLVLRRGGAVEPVEIGGMLVGAVPEARFAGCDVELAPGESCVLYTDGVIEARGGVDGRETFGEERLAAALHGCDVLPAPAVADWVARHATGWLSTAHHDDIAVLVVQAPRPPVPRAGRPRRPASPRDPSADAAAPTDRVPVDRAREEPP